MAKYYAQCGWIRLVLTTDSVESAALAIMDRALQPHLWVYDDPDLSERDCRTHLMLEALLHLPTEIRISERGFESEDVCLVSVPETIHAWHGLIVGMRRLFAQAGLTRTAAVLAGAGAIKDAVLPRRRPR